MTRIESGMRSLAENQAHGLRVQKYNDVIFVHDPIVLEGQSVSYLIDWGNKRTNKRAKGYIRGKPEDPPPVLHTFLYPVKTVRSSQFCEFLGLKLLSRAPGITLGR